MPSYPLRALVLKTTKLGETDAILTFLAEDGQQVRAVAKGMRKPTSRFASRLQPYGIVDLLLHTGRNLEIVSEVEIRSSNVALREDFDRSTSAAVVVNVLDKISLEGQREERLFGLAEASLAAMCTCEPQGLQPLVIAFLIKSMAMHGYRPQFTSCAACACEVSGNARFSLSAGGVLCSQCAGADAGARQVGRHTCDWLNTIMLSTMEDVGSMQVPSAVVDDCFDLVRAFVSYHLPARLKALDFYSREAHR